MDNGRLFHAVFDPWRGCRPSGVGCENCYLAERLDPKYWGTVEREETDWSVLPQIEDKPPGRLFLGKMCDVFEPLKTLDEKRGKLWEAIESSQWTWVCSTRFPEHVNRLIPPRWLRKGWPENLWVLLSVENERSAQDRLPYLPEINAQVRGALVEPILWPVNLFPYVDVLDWVVLGGEYGQHARPMDISWAEAIARDCQLMGCPLWIKQLGVSPYRVQRTDIKSKQYGATTLVPLKDKFGADWNEWPDELHVRMLPGEDWPRS